jgi:protein phosphatase
VTLYHLLTRRYPSGEIEPFQTPRFGDPVPPTRYRPELPRWLENVLLRAVARDRAHRFETAEELRLALERGDANAASAPPHTPLLQRPVARWQAAALVLLIVNLLLLYLLLVR